MIALRDLLEADAFTPVEVAAHAVPGSRWITVDAAEDLITRLHPASRSTPGSDFVPGSGGSSSGDASQALAKAPDPRSRLTAAAGPTSGVTFPSPAAGTPRSAAGPEPLRPV